MVFLVSDAFNDVTSQAHGHGLLLGAEIDDQLHAAARVESKRQSDSLRSRQNEQKRHSDALIAQPPTATELRRAALFLDNAPVPQGWQAAMIRSEARVVGSLYDANFAISANPFSPSDEVLLNAVLTGGWIMTPACFVGSGAAIKYHPALSTVRMVWVSQNAQDQYPSLWRCILEGMNRVADHKWRLLHTPGAFCEQKAKAEKAKRSPQVIAFGTAGEAAGNARTHVFAKDAFIEFIKKPDAARTCLGIAQL